MKKKDNFSNEICGKHFDNLVDSKYLITFGCLTNRLLYIYVVLKHLTLSNLKIKIFILPRISLFFYPRVIVYTCFFFNLCRRNNFNHNFSYFILLDFSNYYRIFFSVCLTFNIMSSPLLSLSLFSLPFSI